MQDLFTWMENTAVARFILESMWMFPALETLHFLGLILLIGSIYVVDLRFLGVAKDVSLQAVLRYIPIAAVGFGINLVTGSLFLFADPFRYFYNLAFQIKMAAVLLAGLNVLWFKYAIEADLVSDNQLAEPGATARLIAVLSMVLWATVIICGRMIPYVE